VKDFIYLLSKFISGFMIFGFGKGKIEVILEKYNYSRGEIIEGKIILKLKKPIRAKKLKVGLRGEKITREIGEKRPEQKKTFIFNFEMPLDKEKEYFKGEYNFEIRIPKNVLQNVLAPKSAIGSVLKGIQILSGRETRVNWYIIAYLDIPSGFDISKKVQINIG